MRIPPSADAAVAQTLRELWAAIDRLGSIVSLNLDLKGRRITNAGDGIDQTDLVTVRQLAAQHADTDSSGDNLTLKTLTVKQRARILGALALPSLDDAGLVFVKSDGSLATDVDGLSYRYTNGALRLADDGMLRWHHLVWLKAGGTPNVSSVFIITGEDNNTTAPLARVVLGEDTSGHPALVPNGANLEVREAGGGGLSDLHVAALEISAPTLLKSNTTLADGAGSSTGTLTNAPIAGDPTKWIRINDNGTDRYIPAW